MLEGLDRTGKTTLAEALQQALNCPILHKGAPAAGDPFTEYLAPLAGFSGDEHLILDRWHWGEVVWPRIFGRASLLDEFSFRYIDKAIANMGGVAVHCTGQFINIWRRIADSPGEPLLDLPNPAYQTQRAKGMFDSVAAESVMPVIRYDFESSALDGLTRTIHAMTRKVAASA